MTELDLSIKGMAAWRATLPEDLKAVVPDEAGKASQESLEALFHDLASSGHRRYAEVMHQHGDILAAAGRTVRVRLLSWVVNRSWPNAASVINALTEEGDDESDGGRRKVAPFFRADMEAMRMIATSRIVRAAADLRTIEAVAGGIRDFEVNYDMQRTGGM